MHVKRQSMGIFVHGICTLIHSIRIYNKSMFQWILNLDEILFEFCIVLLLLRVLHLSVALFFALYHHRRNFKGIYRQLLCCYSQNTLCVCTVQIFCLFLPHSFPITMKSDASFVILFSFHILVGVMIALVAFTIFVMQYFSLYAE